MQILYCEKLSQISLPESLLHIGSFSFAHSGLQEIIIPKGVKEIGSNPFSTCKNLTTLHVSKYNPFFDSRNNCRAIIETSSNTLISSSKQTIIPDDITVIGNSAFEGSQISSINIPPSVIEIEYAAFKDSNLISVKIPNSITAIGAYAFSGTNLSSVIIPEGVSEIGCDIFTSCKKLSFVSLPNSLETVNNVDFFEGENANGLTFPLIMKLFSPLRNCNALEKIFIPEGSKNKFENMFPDEKNLLVEIKDIVNLSTQFTMQD